MLSGAGVHKEFAWKPVLRSSGDDASLYNVDITSLDLNRLHAFMLRVQPIPGGTRIKGFFNADFGNNYDETFQRHGRTGAGALNSHTQVTGGPGITFITAALYHQIQGYIQTCAAGLIVTHKGFGWLNTDNFESADGAGIYKVVAAYTSFNIEGNMTNFYYELQIFQSVFAF